MTSIANYHIITRAMYKLYTHDYNYVEQKLKSTFTYLDSFFNTIFVVVIGNGALQFTIQLVVNVINIVVMVTGVMANAVTMVIVTQLYEFL